MTTPTEQTDKDSVQSGTYLPVDKPLAHKIGGAEFPEYVRKIRTLVVANDCRPARTMAAHLPHLAAYDYRGYPPTEAADHLVNEAGVEHRGGRVIQIYEVARIVRFALGQRFDAIDPCFFTIQVKNNFFEETIEIEWSGGPDPGEVAEITLGFENPGKELDEIYWFERFRMKRDGSLVHL